jgi:hypothetical protein
MGHGIDLNREADRQSFTLAQRDQPVENRFAVPIAREVVVGD